jgi:excisionase family DNA binding protein
MGEVEAYWNELRGTGAPANDKLCWTDRETAWYLGVPSKTVRNLHQCGKLRGIVIGRHLRWRPEDVRKFLEDLNKRSMDTWAGEQRAIVHGKDLLKEARTLSRNPDALGLRREVS